MDTFLSWLTLQCIESSLLRVSNDPQMAVGSGNCAVLF